METEKWRYGIVLDAGSSGTRSYVYRWLRNDLARQNGGRTRLPGIKTKDKWTKKVHVGLSTYGETPHLVGEDHLKPLIDDALTHVPPSLVSETPVFLLATAGMRLLPERQQRGVLDAVCSYLQRKTRLLIQDCDLHIQVIPGATEGLYGWIAANYLVGGFDQPGDHDHGKGHHTYGFLDMGGASAQIAFAPNTTEAAKHADNLTLLRLRNVGGDEQEHRVFVTTWLGFGVNEARKQYLAALLESYPSNTVEYPDPCLPNGVRASVDSKSLVGTTAAAGQPYLLGTGQFDACLRATLPLLKLEEPCNDSPCLFGQHVPLIDFDVNHFIGVSQYWHTTHEIFRMGFGEDPFDLGTYQARVNDFCTQDWAEIQLAVADKAYGKSVDELGASSVCFKASWLISILHDGLGIEPDLNQSTTSSSPDKAFLNPFTAVDTIRDTEVSWTLGKILLYACSIIPASSRNALPVGFGSNTAEEIPPDWVYPSTPNAPALPYSDSYSSARVNLADPAVVFLFFILIVFLVAVRCLFALRSMCCKNRREGRFPHVYTRPAPPPILYMVPGVGWLLRVAWRFYVSSSYYTPSAAGAGAGAGASSASYHRLRNAEAGLLGSGGSSDNNDDYDYAAAAAAATPAGGSTGPLANPDDFELGDWDEDRSKGKKIGGGGGSGTTTPRRPPPYPIAAAIDRAGVALRTESRESIGLGLAASFSGVGGAFDQGVGGGGSSSSNNNPNHPIVRSKSSSRAATPLSGSGPPGGSKWGGA